jgi:hypothetical protein
MTSPLVNCCTQTRQHTRCRCVYVLRVQCVIGLGGGLDTNPGTNTAGFPGCCSSPFSAFMHSNHCSSPFSAFIHPNHCCHTLAAQS